MHYPQIAPVDASQQNTNPAVARRESFLLEFPRLSVHSFSHWLHNDSQIHFLSHYGYIPFPDTASCHPNAGGLTLPAVYPVAPAEIPYPPHPHSPHESANPLSVWQAEHCRVLQNQTQLEQGVFSLFYRQDVAIATSSYSPHRDELAHGIRFLAGYS